MVHATSVWRCTDAEVVLGGVLRNDLEYLINNSRPYLPFYVRVYFIFPAKKSRRDAYQP